MHCMALLVQVSLPACVLVFFLAYLFLCMLCTAPCASLSACMPAWLYSCLYVPVHALHGFLCKSRCLHACLAVFLPICSYPCTARLLLVQVSVPACLLVFLLAYLFLYMHCIAPCASLSACMPAWLYSCLYVHVHAQIAPGESPSACLAGCILAYLFLCMHCTTAGTSICAWMPAYILSCKSFLMNALHSSLCKYLCLHACLAIFMPTC